MRVQDYTKVQDSLVLILIILEVLYERRNFCGIRAYSIVLILIILEVLYEQIRFLTNVLHKISLNPYYTGSTL